MVSPRKCMGVGDETRLHPEIEGGVLQWDKFPGPVAVVSLEKNLYR